MTVDTQQLMQDAELADLALTHPNRAAFERAATQAFRARLATGKANPVAQWVAAVRLAGSEQAAVEAAEAEAAALDQRSKSTEEAGRDIAHARRRLDDALRAARADLAQQSIAAAKRIDGMPLAIAQAENDRARKVTDLLESGVPEATALSVAKPTLGDIAALRKELAGSEASNAERIQIMRSYVALVRFAYPEGGEA